MKTILVGFSILLQLSVLVSSGLKSTLQDPVVNIWLDELDEENQTVEVWISNEVYMSGLQLYVTGLHIANIEPGSILECGWMISWNSSGLLLGFSLAACGPGNYSIATLHYDYTTSDEICINTIFVSGGDGSPLEVESGACLPVEYCTMSGDINGDIDLNVSDVILTVDCIIMEGECTCADINFDDSVNILDIILMVNLILGE